MDRQQITKLKSTFDNISHVTEDGVEYWFARELQSVLGYQRWENFFVAINRTIIACENSGNSPEYQFREVTKLIEHGKGGKREISDYMLTRYACYLIAQNGDSRKDEIAFAQTYFAVQTRKQEVLEQRLADVNRLHLRDQLRSSEKRLSQNIYERGVDERGFGRIRSKGDAALFGGRTTEDIKRRYGITSGPLADRLPPVTIAAKNLAAKNLATEMTNLNIENKDLYGESPITAEHMQNNASVCTMLGERGIRPEELPPEEEIKKVERRVKTEEKRLADTSGKLPKLHICARAKAIRAGFVKKTAKLPSVTLTAAIDKYIAARSNTLSPSTIRGYRIIQRNRFQSVMQAQIGKITNWQSIVNAEAALCSAKTLKNAYGFIRSVLADNGVAPKPVKLPQIIKKERPWLELEQIPVFIDAVHGKSCEIPALLALCSLRRSEIYALTWDKIDLGKNTITVSGAVVPDGNNQFVRKETNKNQSSQRVIPILIPQLREALERSEIRSGPIFTANPNTLAEHIDRICEQAGLPLVGVHGLRHSFASLAYHLGLSQMETMQIGGWSDTKTMQNIYIHLAARDKADAVTKMQDFFQNCESR